MEVDVLLARVKNQVVQRRNNQIKALTLQGMSQECDEGVLGFVVRFSSQAELFILQQEV